jgi:XTP/dITP diphosphohydrolase
VLLIGSGNRDKSRELAHLLEGLPWTVQGLGDVEAVEEPEETETTFEGNALLKARYYSAHFGVACLADDSGLAVDALDGAPGVYSARYTGEDCTYDDNNRKLLGALEHVPMAERTARFVCCAAFVEPEGTEKTFRGTVEGRIAEVARGAQGFGYDPLFVPDGETRSFAEMTREEKRSLSHRGKALKAFRSWLESRA